MTLKDLKYVNLNVMQHWTGEHRHKNWSFKHSSVDELYSILYIFAIDRFKISSNDLYRSHKVIGSGSI